APRAAVALVVVGIGALFVPTPVAVVLALVVVVATAVDMLLARARPRVRRRIATTLARGVPVGLVVDTTDGSTPGDPHRSARRVELRQARPPDLTIEPATGWGRLD